MTIAAFALAPLAFAQIQQRSSQGQTRSGYVFTNADRPSVEKVAKNRDVDVVSIGSATEGNGIPFGVSFPNQKRYRQYYGPGGFNSNRPLKIEAVAFTSDLNTGTGTLMLNVAVTLGIANTLSPLASFEPLEDPEVCFNGQVTAFLNGRPEDLRFPCMREYHYRPNKGDVLVVDIVIHQRAADFIDGFLFGFSPHITRVYQNPADGAITVGIGEGLYTIFELKCGSVPCRQ
jgi:hypothetical protein